jgi:N-formylglutamate deformylase
MDAYQITDETINQVPVIISIPHCGTHFPDELRDQFKPDLIKAPDDTDWFVDQLYDFAPGMGMKTIKALNHRWVIDLNRDPESKPLYTDGRVITGLCPLTTFKEEKLYLDDRTEIPQDEIQRRLEKYYLPYHNALGKMLNDCIDKFGKVLLWDCHSIRQTVPSIYPEKFPDLILGDNDGVSAGEFITEIVSKSLVTSGYSLENNFLFKGGYITRQYGQPAKHQHALQLEMTKINYMDDSESKYHPQRAEKMRDHLKRMFEKVITVLCL